MAEGVESKGGGALGYCEGIKMVIKGNYIPLQQFLLSMYRPDASFYFIFRS